MRWVFLALFSASLAGCSGSDDEPGGTAGSGGGGGTSGSGGSGAGPTTNTKPVIDCSDRTLIAKDYLVHDLTTDSLNYYWLGISEGDIAVFKKPKSGGDASVVTHFPGYFDFLFGDTDLAVAADSQFYMDDTVADDADDYVYFSGDTQIWRAKKDGSGSVESVSGPGLNELGPATCNFSRSILTPDALFVCRQGRLFRMARAGAGTATVVYTAPQGQNIDAFTVARDRLFINGPFDETRHLAPVLTLPLDGGTPTEYGAMLAGLVPDALVMLGDTLLFDSLTVLNGPDLATMSEWATRQGTYKLTGASAAPTKLSETNLELVRGVATDAKYAYAVVGDQRIERISADGVTETYVDCTDSEDDVRIAELVVDGDGVYIRDDDALYRFGK